MSPGAEMSASTTAAGATTDAHQRLRRWLPKGTLSRDLIVVVVAAFSVQAGLPSLSTAARIDDRTIRLRWSATATRTVVVLVLLCGFGAWRTTRRRRAPYVPAEP